MSLNAVTFHSPAQGQQQSPLFSKLPPELRNRIYGMAFENELDSIDLLAISTRNNLHINHGLGNASLPACTLLTSCQMVYLESRGIFDATCQAYWQKEFVLDLRANHTSPSTEDHLRNMPHRYLAGIRNLTFLTKHQAIPIKATWTWSDEAQTWHIEVNKNTSFACEDQGTLAEVDKIRQTLLKADFHRTPRVTNATAKDEIFPSQPFTTGKIHAVMTALAALENAANRSLLVNTTTGGMASQGPALTYSHMQQLATLAHRLHSQNLRFSVSRRADSETDGRLG